jgi:hypothetical protein
MIDFIYVIMVLVYCLLVFSIMKEELIIGLLAGMGIIIVGVYLIIYGAGDISNFLTSSFGIINVALGSYLFIGGSLEEIEKY